MRKLVRLGQIIFAAIFFAVGGRALADGPTSRPAAHVNHAGLLRLGWQLAGEVSTFQDLSAPGAIDLLHSLGFHHTQLSPERIENTDELLAKLKSVHMDAVSYGVVDLAGNEADLRKIFDLAKKLRVKVIVANPADESLDIIDKLAGEYRINVAIINRAKPGDHWNPDDVLRLLDGRSARLGFCADLSAWEKSGLSPVVCVNKLAGHIMEIRLNDIVDPKDESESLGALKQQGFRGICAVGSGTGIGDDRIDRFTQAVNVFSDIVGNLARVR
jgi:sugar phosphate isomerase/epimerase